MRFLILRVLTHSELGMFHEYRRLGKEGSKQRAINFDADVVNRVFPTAKNSDRISLILDYDTDTGVRSHQHWLTRQAKNWRLEGNCPRDSLYAFVEPRCLFALEVDAGTDPATGAWVVFPMGDAVTEAVLSEGETGGLVRAGMIALHGQEGARVNRILNAARPDMFGALDRGSDKMSKPSESGTGGKHLPPHPQRLAEIIAGTGHTFVTGTADIVDNAISADATEVEINFSPPNSGHGRWLTIKDNGHGMSETELEEAMTLGSDADYEENSLGKFGYGLKGASWSQARMFTVVSRRRGNPICHLTWDIENLGDWVASNTPLESWAADATQLGDQGTAVLWRNMIPPPAAPAVPGISPHSAEIMKLDRHLGLVFHRFLEGQAKNRKKIRILINGKAVEPNNPVGHPLTAPYDVKSIRMPTSSGDQYVLVQPFLLPSEAEIKEFHKDDGIEELNKDLNRTGLYGKRNETQGLFIYRNDRLIKWGGWHEMWSTTDEKTKLARVAVSFDSNLDESLNINITKRSVNLPAFLQEEIKKLAIPARNDSKAKYKRTRTQSSAPHTAGRRAAAVADPRGERTDQVQASAETPQPEPESPQAEATERPISIRSVTTDRFAWKLVDGLTGRRDLEVSALLPELVSLAGHLADDSDATTALAAFLALLDERGVQEVLLDPSSD